MRTAGLPALCLIAVLAGACRSSDPVDRLAAQLDDSSRREHAIDGLLVLVRQAPANRRAKVKERVIYALMEAYREDVARPQIVAALALLKDARAAEVFVAALQDAERGGGFFEAAVRSARMIGELGLKKHVPVLVSTLQQALKAPREDRNTWLERSLIGALERIGDRRATPVLISALRAEPSAADFYVSRMAARALGRLRDPRAVGPLVASLGATTHGLLLFEESRRALCRIGEPAVDGLLAAARARGQRQRPAPNAAAAVEVVADLGLRQATAKLAELPRKGDPPDFVLATARSLLRLGDQRGSGLLDRLLDDRSTSATTRREALDLLGWYGHADDVLPRLRTSCGSGKDPAGQLVCWSAALAFSRSAGAKGIEALDKLLASGQDKATRHNLQTYRTRLEMVQACDDDPGCFEQQLTRAANWRQRERAALELGRRGGATQADSLAAPLPLQHPQVKRAILTALEQLEPKIHPSRAVIDALRQTAEQPGKKTDPHGATPPAVISRALCLAERLQRRDDVNQPASRPNVPPAGSGEGSTNGPAGGGTPGKKPTEKR